MASAGEGYVAAPPPAYAPPGQQTEHEIAQAPAPQEPPAHAEQVTDKTAPPQQDGVPVSAPAPAAMPAANGQPEMKQQRMVIPLEKLGDLPADVDCPYCKKVTRTKVVEEDSGMTWLMGGVIAIFCICLACLPCCMGAMQNVDHYCSVCNGRLTHRPYDGQTQVVATPRDGMVPQAVPSKY